MKSREKHNIASLFIYFTCLTITILFGFHLLYNNNNKDIIQYTNIIHGYNPNNTFIQPKKGTKKIEPLASKSDDIETPCNLSEGQWISDQRETLYTNYSCKTVPYLINCFLHGRKDRDFLHWRWKPDQCDLPRFSPETFLTAVKGKTMAFIGDSLSRNHMESLLCLLSTVETPKQTEKDTEGRFVTWEFPKHNFTLKALWSQFLVTATEILVNGSATGGYNLHLDKPDKRWTIKLPSIDYAIFSCAPWFFRPNHIYENNNLIGCIYCNSNLTHLDPGPIIGKAHRSAFRAINNCTNCRKIFTVLRTYSPLHFENGTWNNGGGCYRTKPIGREEVDKFGPDLEYRRIQVGEIEIARKEGGQNGNKSFEVLDVTEMMMMRPDGHPGEHQGKKWMTGYNDCVHWCLPGPIDVWNEILLELIKRQIR